MQTSDTIHTSAKYRIMTTILAGCLALGLAGCANFNSTAATAPVKTAVSVHGSVHGGQQPVTGSHIYLYAVGSGGYGTASTSELTAQAGATADSSGNYYLTTDSTGYFTFTTFNCPTSATPAYLLAVGGNPGQGGTVNNTAITALAALGPCGNIGATTSVNINEVTTVAMVLAAQQFMTDGSHVASGASQTGLFNAMYHAGDLVYPPTGAARTNNIVGTGSVPATKINALGNVLAPCLNSAGSTSAECTNLFSAVTPSGGTQPSDIVGAMLLIAQNPGNNVQNIFGLATATPPFQPTINASTPPNDLTVAITYTGGGMTAPGDVVIDASGNAFIGNSPSTSGATGTDSIVGFGYDGSVLTGATGYTNGIHVPNAVAFDQLGNIWSTDLASGSAPDQVVKLTSAGALLFAFNDSTVSSPQGIALDSGNNAWITNQTAFSVDQILANGTRTLAPVKHSNFYYPTGIGIDSSGFIFAAGTGSGGILKLNSSGAYVANYFVAGLTQPLNISIDASDNIFSINNDSSAISELNGTTGTGVTPYKPQPSLSNAYVLAIDGAGGQWYANCRVCSTSNNGSPDNLTRVAPNGAQNTGTADGFQDPNLNYVGTAAIDASGNVWVTNNGGGATGSVTEFIGIAPPVVTPIATASATGKLGTKP